MEKCGIIKKSIQSFNNSDFQISPKPFRTENLIRICVMEIKIRPGIANTSQVAKKFPQRIYESICGCLSPSKRPIWEVLSKSELCYFIRIFRRSLSLVFNSRTNRSWSLKRTWGKIRIHENRFGSDETPFEKYFVIDLWWIWIFGLSIEPLWNFFGRTTSKNPTIRGLTRI